MKDRAGLPVTYAAEVPDLPEELAALLTEEQRATVAGWVVLLREERVKPSVALGYREQLEAWATPETRDGFIRWIEEVRPHDDDTLPSWMFCEG